MGYDKVSRFGGFRLGSLKTRSDHDRLLLQRSDQQKQETKEKNNQTTWMIELRGTDMEYCLEKSFKNSRWNRLEKNMLDKERHCTSLAVNFYLLCRCFLWPLIAGGTRGNVGSRSISFIFLWYTYTTGGKSFIYTVWLLYWYFAKQSFL